jgi:hypothetical protein
MDAALDDVRAEPRVQLLVPALPDEVEVELAEARRQSGASSSRTIPSTGIPTQSGRLFSS